MMRSFLGLYLFTFILFAPALQAAEVVRVKGSNVLIDLKGDSPNPGDMFYAVKPDGKRAAIIQISKVKSDKATGKVIRGKASEGQTLEPKAAGKVARSSGRTHDASAAPSGRSYWGVLAGYSMDSMTVNINDSSTNAFLQKGDLSGTGYSIKGLF
ncbi:MAG: hypothetical protein AB7H97_22005, partial [Pseudobdellovibrionaceae bacterium]